MSEATLHTMASTLDQVTRDALALSEIERAQLAHELLRSLESLMDDDIEAAWTEEVTARANRVREGTAQGRPADEVFGDIRARYQA
jgi:putative addiction module component (TIGR02574 family)